MPPPQSRWLLIALFLIATLVFSARHGRVHGLGHAGGESNHAVQSMERSERPDPPPRDR